MVLGGCGLLGLLAGRDPELALLGAVGLLAATLVFADLALGVALLAAITFLDVLPDIGALSLAKAVGLLLVLSFVATVTTRRDKEGLGSRPLLAFALLLFMAWATITLGWVESRSAGLSSLSRYGLNLLLFPIVFAAVRSRRQAGWVLAALVAGAAVAAAAGLTGTVGASGAELTRATGTIGDANELAAALLVGIFVAGGFAATSGTRPLVRLLCAAISLMCLAGVMLSLSRGGLVALGVALLAAVLVSGRWRARMAAIAGVVAISGFFYFALFASLPARERVTDVGGGTGRLDLWTVGWRMFEDRPLQGVGVGNFRVSSIHYLLRPGAIERGDFIITTPKVAHNTYLQVLSETGLPGAIAFLVIVGYSAGCVLAAARRFASRADQHMEILCRALFVGIVGYLAAAFFITQTHSKLLWMTLALGPPLLWVARRGEPAAAR